ncbi:MAG: lytic transglycosylase domain-containing protein [Treponema sp.]|nr:lytic transglycosylase domain-containing protein [Treponema sp.]
MKKRIIFPVAAILAGAFFFVAWKMEPKAKKAAAEGIFEGPGTYGTSPDIAAVRQTLQDKYAEAVAYRSLPERRGETDFIRECYKNESFREAVVEFFSKVAGSREVAGVILENADVFGISPGLAFALCWEESRYNPRAVNRKNINESVDRGLFQLNCCSFPRLNEADFFDPGVNAYYGMAHLRWCLDSGGSDVAALAIYNAGNGRVSSGGTPKKTLDYVSRILKVQRSIETLFETEFTRRYYNGEEEISFTGNIWDFFNAVF